MENTQKKIKIASKILGFIGLVLLALPQLVILILSYILQKDIATVYKEYAQYILSSGIVVAVIISGLTISLESSKFYANREVIGKALMFIFIAGVYAMTKLGLTVYANVLFYSVVLTIIIYKLIEVRRNIRKREEQETE